MTTTLPPLPYAGHPMLEWNIEMQDTLHAYGLACWKQGMEDAAKIADRKARRDYPWGSENTDLYHAQADWAEHIANAIRKEITP